eukprot:GHVS01091900.1.p1 GENE.GHVS01091900.1~~GHVS01091900.1.p1  ORF type:complete len:955 (+),score=273.85 GHVS01091900.1:159-2867(+)
MAHNYTPTKDTPRAHSNTSSGSSGNGGSTGNGGNGNTGNGSNGNGSSGSSGNGSSGNGSSGNPGNGGTTGSGYERTQPTSCTARSCTNNGRTRSTGGGGGMGRCYQTSSSPPSSCGLLSSPSSSPSSVPPSLQPTSEKVLSAVSSSEQAHRVKSSPLPSRMHSQEPQHKTSLLSKVSRHCALNQQHHQPHTHKRHLQPKHPSPHVQLRRHAGAPPNSSLLPSPPPPPPDSSLGPLDYLAAAAGHRRLHSPPRSFGGISANGAVGVVMSGNAGGSVAMNSCFQPPPPPPPVRPPPPPPPLLEQFISASPPRRTSMNLTRSSPVPSASSIFPPTAYTASGVSLPSTSSFCLPTTSFSCNRTCTGSAVLQNIVTKALGEKTKVASPPSTHTSPLAQNQQASLASSVTSSSNSSSCQKDEGLLTAIGSGNLTSENCSLLSSPKLRLPFVAPRESSERRLRRPSDSMSNESTSSELTIAQQEGGGAAGRGMEGERGGITQQQSSLEQHAALPHHLQQHSYDSTSYHQYQRHNNRQLQYQHNTAPYRLPSQASAHESQQLLNQQAMLDVERGQLLSRHPHNKRMMQAPPPPPLPQATTTDANHMYHYCRDRQQQQQVMYGYYTTGLLQWRTPSTVPAAGAASTTTNGDNNYNHCNLVSWPSTTSHNAHATSSSSSTSSHPSATPIIYDRNSGSDFQLYSSSTSSGMSCVYYNQIPPPPNSEYNTSHRDSGARYWAHPKSADKIVNRTAAGGAHGGRSAFTGQEHRNNTGAGAGGDRHSGYLSVGELQELYVHQNNSSSCGLLDSPSGLSSSTTRAEGRRGRTTPSLYGSTTLVDSLLGDNSGSIAEMEGGGEDGCQCELEGLLGKPEGGCWEMEERDDMIGLSILGEPVYGSKGWGSLWACQEVQCFV